MDSIGPLSNGGRVVPPKLETDGCVLQTFPETHLLTAAFHFEPLRYKTLLNRTYVDDSAIMRWCPAPNCEYAVECHVPAKKLDTIVPTVCCDCGHRFCFGCGNPEHQPAVCMLVKRWLKKCEDDSETVSMSIRVRVRVRVVAWVVVLCCLRALSLTDEPLALALFLFLSLF